ncbi:capping complex subunit for YIEGIA [Fictibacillus sp. NRS-1165]|uniref:capping complex subunit for YIEGIA n=1 Tax=Fictibacillus sp. NRS-1165 TaxID=3144463 RepID=UPI003D20CF7B
MGKESVMKPNYDILAVVTLNKDRVLSGKPLTLLALNEEEQKEMTSDIAKALKAEVVRMKTKDYLIIRI